MLKEVGSSYDPVLDTISLGNPRDEMGQIITNMRSMLWLMCPARLQIPENDPAAFLSWHIENIVKNPQAYQDRLNTVNYPPWRELLGNYEGLAQSPQVQSLQYLGTQPNEVYTLNQLYEVCNARCYPIINYMSEVIVSYADPQKPHFAEPHEKRHREFASYHRPKLVNSFEPAIIRRNQNGLFLEHPTTIDLRAKLTTFNALSEHAAISGEFKDLCEWSDVSWLYRSMDVISSIFSFGPDGRNTMVSLLLDVFSVEKLGLLAKNPQYPYFVAELLLLFGEEIINKDSAQGALIDLKSLFGTEYLLATEYSIGGKKVLYEFIKEEAVIRAMHKIIGKEIEVLLNGPEVKAVNTNYNTMLRAASYAYGAVDTASEIAKPLQRFARAESLPRINIAYSHENKPDLTLPQLSAGI